MPDMRPFWGCVLQSLEAQGNADDSCDCRSDEEVGQEGIFELPMADIAFAGRNCLVTPVDCRTKEAGATKGLLFGDMIACQRIVQKEG